MASILVKLTRRADVKIDMIEQAHRLAGAPQFFGDSYAGSFTTLVPSRDSLQDGAIIIWS